MSAEPFDFDGDTFDPERDGVRLTKQWKDIWNLMSDGRWRTLWEISRATGHPEASVSARLRDFRKYRFGSHTVERSHVAEGLWTYRLTRNPRVVVRTIEGVK